VKGRSWASISKVDAATPVAKIPIAIIEASRLSLWTMAIATRAQTAWMNRHAHLSRLTRESSAFRLKRTKRHRTSIKRPPTKRKIGLSRRWAKLVATCLSKRTDNPASYQFGDISLQEVMAARLSGLGFRRRLGAGSILRRCASPNTIMWSRHSRRIVPISLSTYGFCHGDRGAVGLSRMPMARNRC
jgi:hypothetical protein